MAGATVLISSLATVEPLTMPERDLEDAGQWSRRRTLIGVVSLNAGGRVPHVESCTYPVSPLLSEHDSRVPSSPVLPLPRISHSPEGLAGPGLPG
jgi:hypothetical protein